MLVGVGASSALAFRYDLWSVRQIDRDLLAGEEKFAIAPPTGVSPYARGDRRRGARERSGARSCGPAREPAPRSAPRSAARRAPRASTSSTAGRRRTRSRPGLRRRPGTRSRRAWWPAWSPTRSHRRAAPRRHGRRDRPVGRRRPQTVITDEQRRYRFDRLPPGTYTVTYYYGDATIERSNVAVAAGRSTAVDPEDEAERRRRRDDHDQRPRADRSTRRRPRPGVTITRTTGASRPGPHVRGRRSATSPTSRKREDRAAAVAPPSPVKQATTSSKAIVEQGARRTGATS